MGKAYSEDERFAKKTALMESALSLFHESGAKSLSIRELTKRAGISQGGFYTFWDSKQALLLDVIKYRAEQKLDLIVPLFEDSLADPRGFLKKYLLSWSLDMKEKISTKPLYRESFMLLKRGSLEDASRISLIYRDFLKELSDLWIRSRVVKSVELGGLVNLLAAIGVLLTDHIQVDDRYFEDLLEAMITGSLEKYIII